ncbi:MAG: toxin TcdB middle/N-terminal domain-containing protein [Verrucomicrobiales bacterium]
MGSTHIQPPLERAFAFVLCLSFLVCNVFAEDKSGVSANTISLPSGPGSIEGLGEAFQPTLNTGTAKYAVPLTLPPGTRGMAPNLALRYEGGGGNGCLGYGWSLPMDYVQRQTDKGIPRYVDGKNGRNDDYDSETDEADEADRFINEMKEELVPVENAAAGTVDFFCENEGPFIRYRRVEDRWEAREPDGTRLVFGRSASARIAHPEDPSKVFRWLLEEKIDTNGNTVRYRYRTFPGIENRNQAYCVAIEYGPGAPPWEGHFHFAAFSYEDRDDWFEDCRSGFAVATGKRLESISIGTQGVALEGHLEGDFNGDGIADSLNRRYNFGYVIGSHWSLLEKVTPIGADGVSALPASTFGYTECRNEPVVSVSGAVVNSQNAPPVAFDRDLVDLADLNGDGLPDLLRTSLGGSQTAYFNEGERDGSVVWSGAKNILVEDERVWNLTLDKESSLLADIDGDGLSDLVQVTGVDDVYFFKNLGGAAGTESGWGRRQAVVSQLIDGEPDAPPSPYGNPDVHTADLDFDKHTDIIQSLGGEGYRIWFNREGREYSHRVPASPESEKFYDFTESGVEIADMNGDRVPDIAHLRPTGIRLTAGLGHGAFDGERTMIIPDAEDLSADQLKRARLQDVSGDGLADLVVERADGNDLWFWENRGNWTLGPKRVITGMPASLGIDSELRWADLNGNGTVDLVFGDSAADGPERIRMVDIGRLAGCVPRPHLLRHIDNGIGQRTEIVYETSTFFMLADGTDESGSYTYSWPHSLPFPVDVVSAIHVSDSLGNTYISKFSYHDGYYDPVEKQFRGFARAEQTDLGDPTAPTLVTSSTFDVGAENEVMKGKMLRQIAATETADVFTDAATEWNIKMLHTGLDGRFVAYAHARFTSSDILERGVGTARRIETGFDYDDYGNEIERREYGVVEGADLAAFHDERVTVTEYALNPSSWLLRYPRRTELRTLAGEVIVRKDSFYDDETFGGENFGEVTLGNLTMVREWPDPSNPAEFITSSRTRYDIYGNPIELLDPLYGQQPGHWRQIAYDEEFRSFPVSETIHTGGTPASLHYRATYDRGLGVLTTARDFNNNETSFDYDPLARLVGIVKPGDSPEFPTETYSYHLAQTIADVGILNWVETKKRETAGGGTFDCRAYVDGLGRALQSICEGAEPGQFVVSGATTFNARKEKARIYLPYFSSSFDFTPPASVGAGFSDFVYDATLRSTETINPPETIDGPRRSSRTVYEPLLTRLFDEEDNTPSSPHFETPHVQYVDGLGRLVGVDEINKEDGTPVTYPTRYRYDVNDQLVTIADSQNNLKSMHYDGLKRMTFMDDPDRGVMHYTYDDASNLTRTVDAKGQEIAMAYDGANRILTEDYLDANGFSPDVSYSYDTAAPVPVGDGTITTAKNTLGKLISVADLSGAEHLSYDERGRTAWKIKRIPDPRFGVLASYETSFSYDSLDRLTQLGYPDGDSAGYGYNTRNLPHTITGGPGGFIISGITYKASGQLETTTYGNGVATSYGYDPRLRLRDLKTENSQLKTLLINFAYQFDAASNITRIDDNRAAIPAADPRKNTQVFGYDDLYRLTSVQYPALLGGSAGSIGYTYDRIGNMLSQGSNIAATENGLPLTNLGTMSYGGTAGASGRIGRSGGQPGPHALTAVSGGSRSYPYDANGNMEAIDGMACTWDFKDRLVVVENAQMRAEYTYDYTDRRITKIVTPKAVAPHFILHPSSFTLYPDRTFEIREDGAPTKYVWNGETRVARVATNLNATLRLQRFRLQPGWNVCTLAVALTNAGTQLGVAPVQEIYRYDAGTQTYATILPGEAIPAGTLLRVRASAAAELAVRGTPAAAASVNYPAGRHWIGNATFQPLDLATALPAEASLWFWQAGTQAWRYRLPGPLSTASDAPARLEPGEAIFALHTAAFTVAPADPTLEVRYYHQDHLGSSSVMTDATGQLVSESTFYPFGHPRNEHEPRNAKEAYGFTQKERDRESGLNYFEARFLPAFLSRFSRPDPLKTIKAEDYVASPQQLNLYSYARNAPTGLVDPSGLEEEKPNSSSQPSTLDTICGGIGNAKNILSPVKDGASVFGADKAIKPVSDGLKYADWACKTKQSYENGGAGAAAVTLTAKFAGDAAKKLFLTVYRSNSKSSCLAGAVIGSGAAGVGAAPGCLVGVGVAAVGCYEAGKRAQAVTEYAVETGGNAGIAGATKLYDAISQKAAEAYQSIERGIMGWMGIPSY